MGEENKNLLSISQELRQRAQDVIKDTQVVKIWRGIGAQVNLVGSLAMDLMMRHRDIDYHIYTEPFSLADSFKAITKLAEHPRIRSLTFSNLIEAEDRCVEWHAYYQDSFGEEWQIDMIHILIDSQFAGHFEKVAERVTAKLNPETRTSILAIKNAVPDGQNVMGIRIYHAVIEAGVKDLEGYIKWEEEHPISGIDCWMP